MLVMSGHTGEVRSIEFSPDGRRLLSGGDGGDTTERLWDWQTGQELIQLRSTNEQSRYATFSPDGTMIATVDLDPPLRVRTALPWNDASG